VLIAKSPAKAVFPLAAATVNLSVFTAKSPVELKLVFVLNEPSTVIAVPDSETKLSFLLFLFHLLGYGLI